MCGCKKRFCFFICLFIFLSASLCSGAIHTINPSTISYEVGGTGPIRHYNDGYRYNIQGWVYVHIEGDPYERGYQYGYLLAEEIVDLMTRWSNMIHNHPRLKSLNGLFSQERYETISELWWTACKQVIVDMYWEKFPEEYQEEIRGIADGVNQREVTFHMRAITHEDVLTSNMMYEFLSKVTFHRLRKGFHPVLTFLKILQDKRLEESSPQICAYMDENEEEPAHHKCNGFIATGDASTFGQLIISNSMWSTGDGIGMWWWSYYITFRWNLVLDILPSSGNRVIMASAPGYIWSDHDFYQNDNGIVFLETTNPQGLWDNKGLPLAVRARLAVQYSNSIDDVIYYLRYRNDGCMNAVWLIGDTKTGEISRFELGYRHSWENRTSNGFHWSANNPMNFKVRVEKLHLKDILIDGIRYFLFKKGGRAYSFPRYRPTNRDRKFEELGNYYYGDINIDIVKSIMSSEPFTTWSPDCKITDSNLVENNGLWVVIGNPDGREMTYENLDEQKIREEIIPSAGWVRLFGLPEKQGFEILDSAPQPSTVPSIRWSVAIGNASNVFSSANIIENNVLYSSASTGGIAAVDPLTGVILWNMSIGLSPTAPLYYDDKLFIGTVDGLEIIELPWLTKGQLSIGKILSPPIANSGLIIVGTAEGHLYAFNGSTSNIAWEIDLSDEIYLSNEWDHYVFAGSGTQCHKINCVSGEIEWRYPTDAVITSRPFVAEGVVYFGSWDTYVYAVDADTGALKWKYETGWGVETTPVVDDGIVIVGSHDHNVYALHQDNGSLSWVFSCKAGIHSSPAVGSTCIIIGSDDGSLYCLNRTTGVPLWSFTPGHGISGKNNYATTPLLSTPTIHEDAVYIGTIGTLYNLVL